MSITFPYKFHEPQKNNYKLIYQVTFNNDHSIFEPIHCNSEQEAILSAFTAVNLIYPTKRSQFQIYLIGNYHSISQNSVFKTKPELLCTFEEIASIEKYALSKESEFSKFFPDAANSLIMRDALQHSPLKAASTFPRLLNSNVSLKVGTEQSEFSKFPLKQINDLKQTIQ